MTEALARQATSDVCVIMPMFNEAAVVADVIADVRSVFPTLICVDDGSTDGSADQAHRAGAVVVRHPVNLGAGAALQTGLQFALKTTSATHFLTIDADGQHAVADAERLVNQARTSGVDVILGSRFLTSGTNFPTSRRLVLRTAVVFTRMTTGLAVSDTHNGLRVLNRRAAELLQIRLRGMAHGSELLEQIARARLSYEECAVTVRYTDYSRRKGQQNVNAINIIFELLMHKVRTAG